MSSAAPLRLDVRPSAHYRALVAAGHGLFLLLFWLLLDNKTLIAWLLAVWLVSLALCMRLPRRQFTLIWHADGRWEGWYQGRKLDGLQLRAGSWVQPAVVYLPMSAPLGGVLIFRDAVGDKAHHQLRQRLSWDTQVP